MSGAAPARRVALTAKQFSVLAHVVTYARVAGESPTASAVARRIGCSRSVVVAQLEAIAAKGYAANSTTAGILARLQ